MDHAYDIITNHGVDALGHDQYVVDGINSIENIFISMLMGNVKFPGVKGYY